MHETQIICKVSEDILNLKIVRVEFGELYFNTKTDLIKLLTNL